MMHDGKGKPRAAIAGNQTGHAREKRHALLHIIGHSPARVAQDEGVAQLQAEKMCGIHSGIHAGQYDGRVSRRNGEIALVKGARKFLIAVV